MCSTPSIQTTDLESLKFEVFMKWPCFKFNLVHAHFCKTSLFKGHWFFPYFITVKLTMRNVKYAAYHHLLLSPHFPQDVIGCTQEMDFILWPRNDIEKIVCLLFSRWKGADDEPYRPVQVRLVDAYFRQLLQMFATESKKSHFLTYRPSLNFTTVTTRSSACTLWVVKTKLERWWTTRVSLYFSSWTDSTYRWVWKQLKPHNRLHRSKSLTKPYNVFLADSENQGYSFQVVQPLPLPAPGSADLLGRGRHRGSPPSIHAWLGLPVQLSHMGKAFPLPPAETFRSKVMSPSPPVLLHKDLNLCSDITCFCPPLPALGLIQFHPCVLFLPPPLP